MSIEQLAKKSEVELANIKRIEQNKVKSFIQNGKRNLKICLEPYIEKQDV